MNYSSFKPSQLENSNGGKIVEIESLDHILLLNIFKYLLHVTVWSSDSISMILPPFESSNRDGSNEVWIMLIERLDGKLPLNYYFA